LLVLRVFFLLLNNNCFKQRLKEDYLIEIFNQLMSSRTYIRFLYYILIEAFFLTKIAFNLRLFSIINKNTIFYINLIILIYIKVIKRV